MLNSVLFVSVLDRISVDFNQHRNRQLIDHHGFAVILPPPRRHLDGFIEWFEIVVSRSPIKPRLLSISL
jgi:hypothetical protein